MPCRCSARQNRSAKACPAGCRRLLSISIVVLGIMFSLMGIRSNTRALMVSHLITAAGFALLLGATALHASDGLSGLAWLFLTSTGLYIAYIPSNCILFERLAACSNSLGNAGFLIYVADSFGCLGSVAILWVKSYWQGEVRWLAFTGDACLFVGVSCLVLLGLAGVYFYQKHVRQPTAAVNII